MTVSPGQEEAIRFVNGAASMMDDTVSGNLPDATLRRLPYPYRAMLAICSDLDETPDRHVYFESMRFLNTREPTAMGEGVGLEVGNSMYFDMPPDQFAYWNTDDAGRDMIRALIRSGHIDCLHSFGDLATTRRHAEIALEELARHDCRMKVWIDHGTAPSNFGGDIMQGSGDVPGSAVYHADLTCGFGVEYVWRGRVTSVIGQEVPRRLGGHWNPDHPVASVRTVAKEFAKGLLAAAGHEKYAMHGSNQVMQRVALRSGQKVWEFLRANPHWGGVSSCETAEGLGDVLTDKMLKRLMGRQGVCILYTHLGKVRDRREPFSLKTREALRRLSRLADDGRILVTTTRRLLDYWRMIREIAVSTTRSPGKEGIDIMVTAPTPHLDGLTLYHQNARDVRLVVNGRVVDNVQRHGPDHTGVPSLSVPWTRLEFPVHRVCSARNRVN